MTHLSYSQGGLSGGGLFEKVGARTPLMTLAPSLHGSPEQPLGPTLHRSPAGAQHRHQILPSPARGPQQVWGVPRHGWVVLLQPLKSSQTPSSLQEIPKPRAVGGGGAAGPPDFPSDLGERRVRGRKGPAHPGTGPAHPGKWPHPSSKRFHSLGKQPHPLRS